MFFENLQCYLELLLLRYDGFMRKQVAIKMTLSYSIVRKSHRFLNVQFLSEMCDLDANPYLNYMLAHFKLSL